MWWLSRSICHLFCKQEAFKRSLNLCSVHSNIWRPVWDCWRQLTFFGAFVGGGHFRMSRGFQSVPVWLMRLPLPLCVHAGLSCVTYLCKSRVMKSISAFLNRCFSTESMARSYKCILYRKHRRMKRKFSYGLVYFTRVYILEEDHGGPA